MNDDFERKVRTAAAAGWWTVLAVAAVLSLQWVAYLVITSALPDWMLSLWGSRSWDEVQHLWLLASGILKIFVLVLATLCLWLTLWARQLRKGQKQA